MCPLWACAFNFRIQEATTFLLKNTVMSTWLGHRVCSYKIEHYSGYFWVFLDEININIKSVNWVQQLTSLMWLGLIHSVEGLHRTKNLTLPLVKVHFFSLLPSNQDMGFLFLPLDSNWNISTSWVSSLLALRLKNHHQLSWASSFPNGPAIFRLISLDNCARQFLKINLYMYIHPILFLWRSLMQVCDFLLPNPTSFCSIVTSLVI